MRITVLGATGGIGRHVVDQALAAGHSVTAVVRRDDAFPAGVEVVRADPTDAAELESLVKGRDAIISALGRAKKAAPILEPSARAVIAAMRATGTRRLLVVTASGHVTTSNDDFFTRAVVKPILVRAIRPNVEDFRATDALVPTSGLDWTIMRPPRLTNGGRKPFRTILDTTVPRGYSLSRADLAAATLAAASDPATIGHFVAAAY